MSCANRTEIKGYPTIQAIACVFRDMAIRDATNALSCHLGENRNERKINTCFRLRDLSPQRKLGTTPAPSYCSTVKKLIRLPVPYWLIAALYVSPVSD